MSLSDRIRSMINKHVDPASSISKKEEVPSLPRPPVETPPTLEVLSQVFAQERHEGTVKQQELDKELQGIRASLEKLELTGKSSRESHNQTLQFMQQDAEREIKFFERKLREDMAHWDHQLKDREKALDQAIKLGENGHEVKKAAYEEAEVAGKQAAERAENLLKEQEAKLIEERQKWRDLLQTKENDLVGLKQDLSQREADVENDFAQRETQRGAAQELWQTRLKELERQWAEKRKTWEEVMKTKEEERLRLHSSFQEKQAAWQLEQERHLQDLTRREELAKEKLDALKNHGKKETESWQHLAQSREEQLQQLRVKLLLFESESKGRFDQAQMIFQESAAQITGHIQTLQHQLQEEQAVWQTQSDAKDQEFRGLKDEVHAKLRKMEADFTQRLALHTSQKDSLNSELQALQTVHQEALAHGTLEMEKLKEEQTALEAAHQKRATDTKARNDEAITALQAEIASLEKQKNEAEQNLESLRLHWQEELVAKDKALKEAQNAVAPQEAETRKRYAAEEEAMTRQAEALKTRLRALERDVVRTNENMAKAEKEHTSVMQALETDHRNKEEAMRQRSADLEARLRKRLEERRLALDAFLAMKKDEDSRVQAALRAKEKERADLAVRLQNLPQELAKTLQDKKQAVELESEQIRVRIAGAETALAQAREESKAALQAKAGKLANVRQSLELKNKEIAQALQSREQILESERAQIEKQLSASQTEVDRARAHWQEEIDKKEKEMRAFQQELQKQEVLQRQTLELEQKQYADRLVPLEQERQSLSDTLELERTQYEEALEILERQRAENQSQLLGTIEQERADTLALETRFQEEKAQWKARLAGLDSERDSVAQSGQEAFDQKTRHTQELEEQIRAQAVAHESRRRDVVHQATVKSRTLQDILHQIEHELKTAVDLFPAQLKEREIAITKLQQDLAAAQLKHQKTLTRFDRALTRLDRLGHRREESLRNALGAVQEEWAKKLATRDSETADLQSSLLEKEAERQGELERLAKQFAEERFQLEKAKEEIEWKLKDRKEVSERQLGSRQKEIQTIENEIQHAQIQRNQELGEKTAAFEAEKIKHQTTLHSLQKQIEETRQTQEAALAAKELELQNLLDRSKEHLRVLGDEFNQKVGSWRATNDTLRTHVEQLKGHVAQTQDHWETLLKEKGNELSALRQELAQWDTRIKSDAEEFDRTYNQDRQNLLALVRKQEKDLQETTADFEKRLACQDEETERSTDDIRCQEAAAEDRWRASLEQWQIEKQSLQQQKAHLEQELVAMPNLFQTEVRQTEDAAAQLRMDLAFKETQAGSQNERLQTHMERELSPFRDRLARLESDEETERAEWEARLRAKDDDLKMLKARIAVREKRLQDESRRRTHDNEKLRKQMTDEVDAARARYNAERTQLETLLLRRREALSLLQAREKDLLRAEEGISAQAANALRSERQQLEESLRRIISQRESLRSTYESLLKERDVEAEPLNQTLVDKDHEMSALRENAKELANDLRKKIDVLRHTNREKRAASGPSNTAAWSAFETGVRYYQCEQWPEAEHAFEDCLKKDPQWGAVYQYLALTYHAQGNTAEAARIAAQAKELDPGNIELATWADRLQTTIEKRIAG